MHTEIETRYFEGDQGLRLAGDVGGDPRSPCVIMLHGGGQTRHSWGSAQRELIRQGFHVVNLDLRGHGDSDWSPDGEYGLPLLAADLNSVIAQINSRPALVGASMGGAMALYALGQGDPLLAQALILVDIVPNVEAAGSRKIGEFMRANHDGFANLEEASDAVAHYYPQRPRPKDPSGLMKNLRKREDGRLYWHWDPRLISDKPRCEPPEFTQPLLEAAENVRVPSLLVRGLQSDIVSDEGIAQLKKRLPQLEVMDVSGAGHMVAGDKNDAFNEGVIAFLQQHMMRGR